MLANTVGGKIYDIWDLCDFLSNCRRCPCSLFCGGALQAFYDCYSPYAASKSKSFLLKGPDEFPSIPICKEWFICTPFDFVIQMCHQPLALSAESFLHLALTPGILIQAFSRWDHQKKDPMWLGLIWNTVDEILLSLRKLHPSNTEHLLLHAVGFHFCAKIVYTS